VKQNSNVKTMVTVQSVHQPTALPDFSVRSWGKKSNPISTKSKKKYSITVKDLGRVMPNWEVI